MQWLQPNHISMNFRLLKNTAKTFCSHIEISIVHIGNIVSVRLQLQMPDPSLFFCNSRKLLVW